MDALMNAHWFSIGFNFVTGGLSSFLIIFGVVLVLGTITQFLYGCVVFLYEEIKYKVWKFKRERKEST